VDFFRVACRGANPVDSYYNTRGAGKKQGEISPTKRGIFHHLGQFAQLNRFHFVQLAQQK